jgi:hypothetical protein
MVETKGGTGLRVEEGTEAEGRGNKKHTINRNLKSNGDWLAVESVDFGSYRLFIYLILYSYDVVVLTSYPA